MWGDKNLEKGDISDQIAYVDFFLPWGEVLEFIKMFLKFELGVITYQELLVAVRKNPWSVPLSPDFPIGDSFICRLHTCRCIYYTYIIY